MPKDNQEFLLQDSRSLCGKNMMFWKDGGSYTTDINQAEVFTQESALRQHQSRASDIPLPKSALLALARPTVDVQYLKQSDASSTEGDVFLLQVKGRFDGNDAYWLTGEGTRTSTDLTKAKRFSKGDIGFSGSVIHWSENYIQSKTRMSVAAKSVDVKKILNDAGISLIKPKSTKKQALRCHGCGSFISEVDYYAGECRRCGSENRP